MPILLHSILKPFLNVSVLQVTIYFLLFARIMRFLAVNNVAAHGIPDSRPLENGDIINVDVTVYLDGFHGDCSDTFLIGDTDEYAVNLVRVTKDCLAQGILACGPGKKLTGKPSHPEVFNLTSRKLG